MIIWLASYPKSGNTWLRMFLKSYFLKPEEKFSLEGSVLDTFKPSGFPDEKTMEDLKVNYHKFEEIVKNWEPMQDYINPKLLVLAADHEIKKKNEFINTVENGVQYSNLDFLVTFGIVPTRPETGYGYIQTEKPFNLKNIEGYKILKFTENGKSISIT